MSEREKVATIRAAATEFRQSLGAYKLTLIVNPKYADEAFVLCKDEGLMFEIDFYRPLRSGLPEEELLANPLGEEQPRRKRVVKNGATKAKQEHFRKQLVKQVADE